MAEKPIVSIIIPTHDYTDELKECLLSVLKNTKVSFEVIVVCVKQIPEEFKQLGEIKFVKTQQEHGPAKNRNIGVANTTKSKYAVFLDSDTIVDKNWLEKTIKYLNNHADIGAGQLKLLKMSDRNRFDSAGEKLSPFGFLIERAQSALDQGQFDQVEKIIGGKTAAMIVRKKAFEKAGGFDPDYFIYWEEEDFCWRVWKSGYKVVFLPWSKVWHAYHQKNQQISNEKRIKLTYYGCRNHILTLYKNALGLTRIKMLISVVSAWIVLSILFSLKRDFGRTKSVVKAFGWLITNHKKVTKKRREVIKKLGKDFYSDPEWFDLIKDKRGFNWYFGKAKSYLLGKPF